MYKPINLSDHRKSISDIVELTSLNIFDESKNIEEPSIFTEAVFNNGKEKLAPILSCITAIKNDLETRISNQINNSQEFDPDDFWRSPNMRSLEDTMKNTFGCRFVSFEPYNEKYIAKDDIFESKVLNCSCYTADRYPIDGIVTDNGFYDNSHSLVMRIHMSVGLMHLLTDEEILAVLLHEIGHNIDPALMTIKYAETNILSKYLTDRNSELRDSEKKLEKGN